MPDPTPTPHALPIAPAEAAAAPRDPFVYATPEEWEAEAVRRFGENELEWRFVCPSCGLVAKVDEWRLAGAPIQGAARSCVGRWLGADGSKTFRKAGGPCNYAGGGLFGLNPVTVHFPDGSRQHVFAFAATVALKGDA